MSAVWPWLNANVVGNLAASFVAWAIGGGYLWIRHIKPHLDAQRDHRADVEAWLADQNEQLDALLANSADQGGRHGVTGQTGYMPPVHDDLQPAHNRDVTDRLKAAERCVLDVTEALTGVRHDGVYNYDEVREALLATIPPRPRDLSPVTLTDEQVADMRAQYEAAVNQTYRLTEPVNLLFGINGRPA